MTDHLARLGRMRDNLTGCVNREMRRDRAALEWALSQITAARAAAFSEAADYAEFYAEERMRLCGDAILHDPILAGAGATPENVARSVDLQIDGTINSAAYHAATHIAGKLREMAK